PEQEAYEFLLTCLHFSLALGAVFGLTAVTAAKSRVNDAASFAVANFTAVAVVAVTCLLLYFFGGTASSLNAGYGVRLTDIARARVGAAMLVSLLAFIVLAGDPEEHSDFARSFFMTHKAFFIALIYGIVLYAGGAGVAGAVEALLYRDMSHKVYMYIGTIAGLLAYAIFIGYFPDFSKGSADPRREAAQKQPRFIEVLLEFIISPLALALTAVLLIWSAKTALTGEQVPFMRLSSIAAAFATVGLWLHIMVTHGQSGLAGFYRRVFPFAAIIILIFEAGVLFIQIERWGIKTTEYNFIIIWLLTMAAAVLLIFLRQRAHVMIAALTCALAVFSVLPALGYHALPVTVQTHRLEQLLTAEGMLEHGAIVPAASEPERPVREAITDTVNYLSYAQDAKLPPWFEDRLNEGEVFERTFGFQQTWPNYDPDAPSGDYVGTYLSLPPGVIDVSGYRWAVSMRGGKEAMPVTIEGEKGTYQVYWGLDRTPDLPSIRIDLDGRTIHEEDMGAYFDGILAKYPLGDVSSSQASLEDMSYVIELPEARLLLIFESVNVYSNTRTGD
ncbi:MAG: DUF4153 domain-containing protein, partial [Clostridiales bacterium]|nr:DUF4153 domain-containing protein [Clostridiales bacterium]